MIKPASFTNLSPMCIKRILPVTRQDVTSCNVSFLITFLAKDFSQRNFDEKELA